MVFLAVADAMSFTAAAERLGCSKAQVSKQVAALERKLGVPLLFRTTRRLSLTEAGTIYLGYCRTLQETLGQAEQAVSMTHSQMRGPIRISAPTSFGEVFLAELMLAFTQLHPAIRLELDVSTARRDLVGEGFDLAIRSSRTPDEDLVARPLGMIRERVLASPTFLERYPAPNQPEELKAIPCLVNTHFRDDQHWLFLRGDASWPVTVNGAIAANQYSVLKRLCLAGAGLVRLPLYLVEPELATGQLVTVLSDYELPAAPVFLVYPQSRHRPHRVQVFIDFLVAWFSAPERRASLQIPSRSPAQGGGGPFLAVVD